MCQECLQPNKDRFDTMQFAPGTLFMNQFDLELAAFASDAGNQLGCECASNGSQQPGEGEVCSKETRTSKLKILDYIRRVPSNETICIVSQDSDMVSQGGSCVLTLTHSSHSSTL